MRTIIKIRIVREGYFISSMNNAYKRAVAYIKGSGAYPGLHGKVTFYQRRDGVLVEASISGLPYNGSGFYGFHIHDGENCAGEVFEGSASHLNLTNSPHPEHTGDLPPLINCGGNAYMVVLTDRFGIEQIPGRTVIIHDSADDFTSQPTGNAGNKIGCGVIRVF